MCYSGGMLNNKAFSRQDYHALRDECAEHNVEIQEASHGYTVQRIDGSSETEWGQIRNNIEAQAVRHIIDSGDSIMVLRPSETPEQ